jgi:glutamyl-tRNA synthetase
MATVLEKPVRVRFAPSPTGPLHIGGARTALFNWLFARQNGGKFILRIEDTDKERSTKEYEAELIDGLKWLGLPWDEGPISATSDKRQATSLGDYGPYRQSERVNIYKKYLEKLLEEGKAYYCYCTKEELEAERQAMMAQGLPPKYSGHCRQIEKPPQGKKPQVIRFKTPEASVEFKDLIRGKVSFDASLFGDIVIAKDLNAPLYNFAAVVDDEEMKISHVIRGEEHIPNTPKQILMQKALGFGEPVYAHLPLILNPDRSKMSKRFADTALLSYKDLGYLPEAIVNFLVLLGWHPKHNKEVFTRDELIQEFDLRRVQKAGAIFNQEKLDWLQKEHLRKMNPEDIAAKLKTILSGKKISLPENSLLKIINIERGRIKTLNEFTEVAGFFFKLPEYDAALLVWQKEPLLKIKSVLSSVLKLLDGIKTDYPSGQEIYKLLSPLIEKEGRGAVLWPLRVALSGQTASPDPLEIIEVLGLTESKRRVKIAIDKIERLEKQKYAR